MIVTNGRTDWLTDKPKPNSDLWDLPDQQQQQQKQQQQQQKQQQQQQQGLGIRD